MPERRREQDGAARAGLRPVWSGSIAFGLVTVPVELYSATRRTGVSLRMLGPDGAPLSRQYVCPADGRVLGDDEIVRGYAVAEDEYVLVEDEELEEVAPGRSREIDLARFVDRAGIDPAWFVRPYFLVPGGEQTKAYRLLAEVMEASGRAAIASLVMRGKAYAVAIFADAGVLRAETLRFGDELRRPEDLGLPEPIDVARADVRRFREIVEELAADAVDPDELRDEQAERLREVARAKQARGEDVVEAPAAPDDEEGGAEVVDLMALLRERMREPRRSPRRSSRRAQRDELADATKEALYERARELGIPGRSKMSRDELLASIRKAG